ncbi:MAG: hypothetical protein ABI992_04095 [Chthoniobacterales bacterium]
MSSLVNFTEPLIETPAERTPDWGAVAVAGAGAGAEGEGLGTGGGAVGSVRGVEENICMLVGGPKGKFLAMRRLLA